MDNINLYQDRDVRGRYRQFLNNLKDLGEEIPNEKVEEMITCIIFVLEEHHITYNQACKILNLVNEALTLRAAEVRM